MRNVLLILMTILTIIPLANALTYMQCYQESAFTPNQVGTDTGGQCQYNYTGSQRLTAGWIDPLFVYDGNWDYSTGVNINPSGAQHLSSYWVNYSIPNIASTQGSYWRVKDTVNGDMNLSLITAPITNNKIQLRITIFNSSIHNDGFIAYDFLDSDGNIADEQYFDCGTPCYPEIFEGAGIYWNETAPVSVSSNLTNFYQFPIRDNTVSIRIITTGLTNPTCAINSTIASTNNPGPYQCTSTTTGIINCNFNIIYQGFDQMQAYCYETPGLNYYEAGSWTWPIRVGMMDKFTVNTIKQKDLSPLGQAINYLLIGNTISGNYSYNNSGDGWTISPLLYGNYTLKVNSSGYATKFYTFQVNDYKVNQSMTAYMINLSESANTIITIKKYGTTKPISGATVLVYNMINGQYYLTDQLTSDISGNVKLYYMPDTYYKFIISAPGYINNSFSLNPVVYSTYDVFLSDSATQQQTQGLDQMSVDYYPREFVTGQAINFTMSFKSNSNFVSSDNVSCNAYGFDVVLPGESYNQSNFWNQRSIGNCVSSGSNVTISLDPLIGYYWNDSVKVVFTVNTNASGRKYFSLNLPIIETPNNTTFQANKDKTYGMGEFERVLIATIGILVILGICVMLGATIMGLFLSLFMFVYMFHIGFIPLWIIIPSGVMGFFIILIRGSSY